MSFKFECPSCGQRISATEADAGTIGACPACGTDVEVPAPESSAVAPVPPVPVPIALPPQPTPPPVPVQARPHAPVFASETRGGLMLATVCPACRCEIEVPVPQLPPGVSAAAVSAPKKRRGLIMAIIALVLCAMPWVSHVVMAVVRANVPVTRLPVVPFLVLWFLVMVVAAVLCLAGVISGHVAWRRAAGWRAARGVSLLSLMLGYFTILFMAFAANALMTGRMVLYRPPMTEPPDFTADMLDMPPGFMPPDYKSRDFRPSDLPVDPSKPASTPGPVPAKR